MDSRRMLELIEKAEEALSVGDLGELAGLLDVMRDDAVKAQQSEAPDERAWARNVMGEVLRG